MSSFSTEMENKNYIIHPHRFNLWLFLLSLVMIFGGLTSAYLVARSAVAKPLIFDLPTILWNNTGIIIFSSVTMQFAVWAAKRGERNRAMIGLVLTLILGTLFLVGQFYAWAELTGNGLPFVDNRRADNSVSFFYIFTGLHGVHIVSAFFVLAWAIFKTVQGFASKEKMVRNFELTATFWHFLDLLWVYLFIFLLYTQN